MICCICSESIISTQPFVRETVQQVVDDEEGLEVIETVGIYDYHIDCYNSIIESTNGGAS